MVLKTFSYKAPCGEIILGEIEGYLVMCDWINGKRPLDHRIHKIRECGDVFAEELSPVLEKTIAWLNDYFSGKNVTFSLPVRLIGTQFQLKVWNALKSIPYGSTVSYNDIALSIGRPSAVRAVANAIGANPISIIIPCHRVIGSNGTLTGYAGGLEIKRALLDIESPRLFQPTWGSLS